MKEIQKLQNHLLKIHYKEFIISIDSDLFDEDENAIKFDDYIIYKGNEFLELKFKYLNKKILSIINETKIIFKGAIIDLRNTLSLIDENQKIIFQSISSTLENDFDIEDKKSNYYIECDDYTINNIGTLINEIPLFKTINHNKISSQPEDFELIIYKTLRFHNLIQLPSYLILICKLFIVELDKNMNKQLTTKVVDKINWEGNQTEMIEQVKALIENKTIKGTQKELINKFSGFFTLKIKYPDKIISDIKKRNNGSETLFLDKIKSSLYNYITKEKI